MRRRRPTLRPDDLIDLAVALHPIADARVPQVADDADRLLDRPHRRAGGAALTSHRNDRIPEGARAEGQRESPGAEQVEGCRLVRVILKTHEVEPGRLARYGERDDPTRIGGSQRDERSELEHGAVVVHAGFFLRDQLTASCPLPSR